MKIPVLLLGAITILGGGARADTLDVPTDYPTIQAAINAAANGGVVLVEPGLYIEDLSISNKFIAILSVAGPHATTIRNLTNSTPTVDFVNTPGSSSEDVLYALEGFTLDGSMWGEPAIKMTEASPRIAECIVRDNRADDGVILCRSNSSPTIANTIITLNNQAPNMGLVTSCSIFVGSGCAPRIVNCTIAQNCGVPASGSTVQSGGIYLEGSTTLQSHPVIVNLVSRNNNGYDVFLADSVIGTLNYVDIFHSTLFHPNSQVANSIRRRANARAYWDAQTNAWDPLLIDPASGDCHLSFSSSSIDSGLFDPVAGTEDVDGDPRVLNGTIDRGADEAGETLYSTGLPTPNGSVTFHVNTGGAGRLVALWNGTALLSPPLDTAFGRLFLGGAITILPMPNSNAQGTSTLTLPVPPVPPAPYDSYWQAFTLDPVTANGAFTNLNTVFVR